MNDFTKITGLILTLVLSAPLVGDEPDLPQPLGDQYSVHPTDYFLVYSTHDAWAQQVTALLGRTHDRFYKSFTRGGFQLDPLRERLVCIWFSDRDEFERYARRADGVDMSWSEGYYSARTNRVALVHQADDGDGMEESVAVSAMRGDPDIKIAGIARGLEDAGADRGSDYWIDVAKTTHEAAHQLAFNSGLQKRGVMYPLWASEGLATNFEADSSGEMGPEADNHVRRHRLVQTWEEGDLFSLEELVTTTRVPAGDPKAARILYAQSWGFFRFLFQQRQPQLVRYLERLARMDRGRRDESMLRREFEAAFGPIESLEKAWERFLSTFPRDEDTP